MKKQWKTWLEELRRLRDAACKNLFAAASLAAKIVKDEDFVHEYGEGDEFAANEKLFAECFPHLTGAITLPSLLRLVVAYPIEARWIEYHYNLRAMLELYESEHPAQEEERQPQKRAKMADLEEAKDRVTQLEAVVADVRESESSLRDEVRKLREENSMLRGQVEELRRLLPERRNVA